MPEIRIVYGILTPPSLILPSVFQKAFALVNDAGFSQLLAVPVFIVLFTPKARELMIRSKEYAAGLLVRMGIIRVKNASAVDEKMNRK